MIQRLPKFEIIEDAMVEILRNKTPPERLAFANRMWRFARTMIYQVIAKEHPDWSEEEICRQVAKRISHGAI